MNEQDTDFGDQVGGTHDINDMAPELPEAELYAAQSAAAEHDFQLFEQSRIFTEHGYSLFPGKKYSRVPYAAESVVQMPEPLPPKTQRSSLRHKPNLSDTDSGDQSNTDGSVSNGRRKRFKGGLNVFPNDLMSRPEEFNRIFPTFAPFEETVIGNREDGFQSSSSADSPRSPPPAIRTGFTSVENGRASSEENDYLTAVEPEQMHTDEALLFFEEQKSDEMGIDAASLGNFKTMLGSDRKAVPQYLKKGGSSKDLAEIGYNPEAVTINVNRSKSSVERSKKAPAARGKTKVKTLFKSGPVKDSPIKQDKGKTITGIKKSKVTKKGTTPVKPSPKSASLNKKSFPKSRSIFKVSNKKLTAKQNRAVAAVRKRLQMSKKKREDVWCICRKPHGGRFMICCDQCNEWFHGSCVKVSAAQGKMLSKSGVEYVCPKCKPIKEQSSSLSPVKSNKKKASPVKPIKRLSTNSPVIEPPKATVNPVKNRSAFSKMGLFDIGLPARKLLVSKKPENLETVAKVADHKKKTMSAISSVRSKLLLKKATKQVRLPPPEKPDLGSILKSSASASSAPEDMISVNDSKTPLRRSNRHQKDDESPPKLNQVKDSLNDSNTADDSVASEKSHPIQVKIDMNPRRRKGQSISDSDDILSSPSAKTDSETESLTTSVKRILRHGRSPATPTQCTSGTIVVTHNDQNVIEVSKKSPSTSKPHTSETEEKLMKPLPPAGVSKAKKRALLKATLIKNKSIWNSQYQQMKMALERSAKAKKEAEEEKTETEESGEGKTGKRKPPDDDSKGGPPSSGGFGNSKGGNSKGGNSGGKRPSGRSKSPKSKPGKNGKGSSSSQAPERRQSPRKRSDITIIIESFQFMSSNAITAVSPCLILNRNSNCQESVVDRMIPQPFEDYYQCMDPLATSRNISDNRNCSVKVFTDATKLLNCPAHILLQKTKTQTEALFESAASSRKLLHDCCVSLNNTALTTSSKRAIKPPQSDKAHLLPNVQLLLLAAEAMTSKTSSYLPLLHLPLLVHLIVSSWAVEQFTYLLLTPKALQYFSQTKQLMHLHIQKQPQPMQVPL